MREIQYGPLLAFAFVFCYLPLDSSAQHQAPVVEKKLRFVHAIWRHGDRAPKRKPYEADIYDENYWPRGWNQLTQLGMQQMHELGLFLRLRYVGTFLSGEFDRKEVSIHSSASDRALESAQALLSGMFPPTAGNRFDNSLNWQPIPVHSVGDKEPDPLLRPSSFACPRYQKLRASVREQLEDHFLPNYRELAEELRPILNVPDDQPIKFRSLTELKSIQMEVLHNFTQPDWVYKRWPIYGNKTTLDLLLELRNRERVAEFNGSEELARLSGGFLLGDWLTRARKAANASEHLSPQKMILYSSHDGTLLALLSALRVKSHPSKMPPFAACIIMELYQQEDGGLFVEFFYRTNGTLEQLVPVGCQQNCSLENLIVQAENITIPRIELLYEECGAKRCVLMNHAPKTFHLGLSFYALASLIVYTQNCFVSKR